jgi:hypothetical protein
MLPTIARGGRSRLRIVADGHASHAEPVTLAGGFLSPTRSASRWELRFVNIDWAR